MRAITTCRQVQHESTARGLREDLGHAEERIRELENDIRRLWIHIGNTSCTGTWAEKWNCGWKTSLGVAQAGYDVGRSLIPALAVLLVVILLVAATRRRKKGRSSAPAAAGARR